MTNTRRRLGYSRRDRIRDSNAQKTKIVFDRLEEAGKLDKRQDGNYYRGRRIISRNSPILGGVYLSQRSSQAIVVDPKTELKDIGIKFYNFDPTLAPKGKTAVVTFFIANDFEYWVDLREKDRKKYNEVKEKLANEVIELLEKRFPKIKDKIEVIDVATPATFIRYTNNWKGSYEGWLPKGTLMGNAITETLPGLDNFFMVGHWTRPGGGLPPAASSGKKIIKMICEQDGKEFTTIK